MSNLQQELDQFTGTEQWYRHGLARSVLYTDGVKYLAETAKCYWLLDEIALAQRLPKLRGQEFQVWKLVVNDDKSATLSTEDGNYNVITSKRIPFTDFPEKTVSVWVEGSADDSGAPIRVILLPSEH